MAGKPFYKSKGVMGAGVAIVAAAASLWGVDVGDQASLADQFTEMIDKVVILVAAAVALWGRLTAKDKIKRKKGFRDPGGGDLGGG